MNFSPRNQPTPTNYSPILWLLVALSMGIVFDRMLDANFLISLLASIMALALWCALFFRFSSCGRLQRVATLALFVSVAGLGAAWHHSRWNWFAERDISQFADSISTPICLRAEICSEPRPVASTETSVLNPLPTRSRTRFEIRDPTS